MWQLFEMWTEKCIVEAKLQYKIIHIVENYTVPARTLFNSMFRISLFLQSFHFIVFVEMFNNRKLFNHHLIGSEYEMAKKGEKKRTRERHVYEFQQEDEIYPFRRILLT